MINDSEGYLDHKLPNYNIRLCLLQLQQDAITQSGLSLRQSRYSSARAFTNVERETLSLTNIEAIVT